MTSQPTACGLTSQLAPPLRGPNNPDWPVALPLAGPPTPMGGKAGQSTSCSTSPPPAPSHIGPPTWIRGRAVGQPPMAPPPDRWPPNGLSNPIWGRAGQTTPHSLFPQPALFQITLPHTPIGSGAGQPTSHDPPPVAEQPHIPVGGRDCQQIAPAPRLLQPAQS